MLQIIRFAPSPTGEIHIGNFRTAIFNYVYAKKNNGKFLLRIDNTDYKRNNIQYIDNIAKLFFYFKINIDQINFQTEYYVKINKYITYLKNNKQVYYCNCVQYNEDECSCNTKDNQDGVLVLKKINNVKIYDLLLGDINYKHSDVNRIVLLRACGTPLYNFITVISDIEENVTDVIRGVDHITNTYKQNAIYLALGKKIPNYIHIPLVLDESKEKLSKRKEYNYSISILDLLKKGFLRQCIINHIIRLGWSYKNLEIFNIEDIYHLFEIKNLNKSNCIHQESKIQYINKKHMKNICIDDIVFYCTINNIEIQKNYTYLFKDKNIINRCNNVEEYIYLCKIINLDYMKDTNIENLDNKDKQLFIEMMQLSLNKDIFSQNQYQQILRILTFNKKDGISIKYIIQFIDIEIFIIKINNIFKIIN
ncbi:Glutamate--tRNA ligase [bacterium AB1]|nr:Glutamate--tRNA ligase [bacterium AB1]